jgi:hypothetical protein
MGAERVSELLCTASDCAEPTPTVVAELRCLTSGQAIGVGGRSLTQLPSTALNAHQLR